MAWNLTHWLISTQIGAEGLVPEKRDVRRKHHELARRVLEPVLRCPENIASRRERRVEGVGRLKFDCDAATHWSGPFHFLPLCVVFRVQVSASNRRKYSLENVVSAKVQGPQ